ncbi:MAG: hypothetical protein IT350_19310 [Deltaproteobacteria bacterium]|nr:hypothetical protein [Deltaproteobacteria bacterium]
MAAINAKKMAAITAAVTAYLAAESAARAPGAKSPAPPPPSPWGMSGRQDAMHLRNMMQRRAMR